MRWPEWVHILLYVHDTVPLSAADHALVVAAAQLAYAQGFNWVAYYTDPNAVPNFNASLPYAPAWTLTEHGVNNAMALKAGSSPLFRCCTLELLR